MLVALLIAQLQVPLTVLTTAEVAAASPQVVRSPMEGVVGEVVVRPNSSVVTGDLLLRLDDSALRARLDVARQELSIAEAEHLRAEQAAVGDRQFSAQLPVLKARISQRKAEVHYVQSLLQRIEIRAASDGIIIIHDLSQLEGQVVVAGQRLMTIADPDSVEVELWLPVGDSISLPEGAKVSLYLNSRPLQPLDATLTRLDYLAEVSQDGVLAYRGRATLDERDTPPRIGLRGTAKIYGDRVALYYYLLRRPYAALRQYFGI
ncbi:MAG: HlyD family efflux transporter periplasmic adaptor subunit [Gammaproteobacteria bacterium]|nr:HlyD family efflux transporter periplasmic adaptor subunit [Gammaproteobacteria bacterium]